VRLEGKGGGLLGSIRFVPPTAMIDLHILLLLPPPIICSLRRRRRNNFDDDTTCSFSTLLSETSIAALDTVIAVERIRHIATCMSFILLGCLYLFYLQMMNYFMRQWLGNVLMKRGKGEDMGGFELTKIRGEEERINICIRN